MNYLPPVLFAPGSHFVDSVRFNATQTLAHLLLLGICLQEFDRLTAEQQRLLTAVDVQGESYGAFAERTGTYRPSLPQLMFGARHRLFAGVIRRAS